MVTCALILHNICVSDRVMGACRVLYNPANNIAVANNETIIVEDLEELQEVNKARPSKNKTSAIGVNNCTEEVQDLIGRKRRWMELHNKEEFARLHKALMEYLGKQYVEYKSKKSNKKSKK